MTKLVSVEQESQTSENKRLGVLDTLLQIEAKRHFQEDVSLTSAQETLGAPIR